MYLNFFKSLHIPQIGTYYGKTYQKVFFRKKLLIHL